MNVYAKLGIVVALATAIGAVVILKQGGAGSCCPGQPAAVSHEPPAAIAPPVTEANPVIEMNSTAAAALPKMVELGSTTCVPCKMMKPILEELTAEYAGKLDVMFVDVNRQSDAADQFNIRVIPTQVFLAPDGKEVFRHEGFFPKEDILAKWKELGYEFN